MLKQSDVHLELTGSTSVSILYLSACPSLDSTRQT